MACDPEIALVTQEVGVATTGGGQLPVVPLLPPDDDPLEVEPPEELLDVEPPEDDPLEVELPEEPLDVELPEDDPLEVELPEEPLDVETAAPPPPQACKKIGTTTATDSGSKCRFFLEL